MRSRTHQWFSASYNPFPPGIQTAEKRIKQTALKVALCVDLQIARLECTLIDDDKWLLIYFAKCMSKQIYRLFLLFENVRNCKLFMNKFLQGSILPYFTHFDGKILTLLFYRSRHSDITYTDAETVLRYKENRKSLSRKKILLYLFSGERRHHVS